MAAPAFILLLVALSLLTGYSFAQAVELYAQASRSAAGSPALARSLSPFDGILVPSFGAMYLAATLLYPFLAIRSVALEQESGSLKLLLQLPLELPAIIATKLAALAAAWLALLLLPLSAAVLWTLKGGHVHAPELINLLAGHSLYGFAITGIAFLAASATGSGAAAAIVSLAAVVGNWALDFAASRGGLARDLAAYSLTACLRSFERGLFDSSKAATLLVVGAGCAALASIWLQLGRAAAQRWRATAAIIAGGAVLGVLAHSWGIARDVTEDRRNSFSEADERALSELAQPLTARVYMTPDDSRFIDLDRAILSKLRRTVRHLHVVLEAVEGARLGAAEDRYGVIAFEYGGKAGETRSTSEEEILPLIYGLAAVKVAPGASPEYPGYPLTADAGLAQWWFYLVVPVLAGGWWWRKWRHA